MRIDKIFNVFINIFDDSNDSILFLSFIKSSKQRKAFSQYFANYYNYLQTFAVFCMYIYYCVFVFVCVLCYVCVVLCMCIIIYISYVCFVQMCDLGG